MVHHGRSVLCFMFHGPSWGRSAAGEHDCGRATAFATVLPKAARHALLVSRTLHLCECFYT